jgi:tetratricopeptide (TPR) repeat protein
MANVNRVTCPRCGAPVPCDDPAGPCLRCLLSDTQGGKTEISLARPSAPGRMPRKLALASAVAAIAAILLGGLWFGSRREQPADAEALFERGANLHREGKLEGAIAAYRDAIRLKPDLAEAHYSLGKALKARGKLEAAVTEYRTAIRLKSDFVDARNELGISLEHQGKLEEAVAEYRSAIRLNPDLAEHHYRLIERALADTDG